jgi:TonB family protein
MPAREYYGRGERGERGIGVAFSRAMNTAVQAKILNLVVTALYLVRSRTSAITPRLPRSPRPFAGVAMWLALGACGEPPEAEIEPPQVLTDSIPFIYPLELWDHNISGQTILLVRVDATGKVDSVSVDAPSGYPEFDSAAVQGARQLRFIAARQGDSRIPMWTKVPVRFTRDTTTKMGIGGE